MCINDYVNIFYLSKHCDAVFKSTPTKLTHSLTTSSKADSNDFLFKSCWYIPTPKCFGSTLTNSASGSCTLRASEA